MIDAKNLSKSYRNKTVLHAVDLTVERGEIFGLLGPNGAGKTTLMRLLTGLIAFNSGSVLINGLPIKAAKSMFGYVSQYFGQYEELSVWQNIEFYASLYGVDNKQRLTSLLHRYGLTPFMHQNAGSLSGGYKRRLALACALAHDPDLLFLDEPTAGIDPVTRKLLWDDLYMLAQEGKTLLVTTHYMEEAQRCDRLAFLSDGRIVATDTPAQMHTHLGDVKVLHCTQPYHPALHHALQALPQILVVNQFADDLRILVPSSFDTTLLQPIFTTHQITQCDMQLSTINLEDIFIALTRDKEVV